ncbi:unnamed protein product [Phytophthora lilii]|uniref:thermospermine synthase n=1 Tax=Phytophthora lilii TaxID=2077276 RepID=A0A9W6UD50_9STRA|nr:unnamed protein product [Phytophthora lilii]
MRRSTRLRGREDAAGAPDATSKRQKTGGDAAEAATSEKRAAWDEFLQSKCFLQVPGDFYDVFELAAELRPDAPCGASVVSALGPIAPLSLSSNASGWWTRLEQRRSTLGDDEAADLSRKIEARRGEKSRSRGQTESALRTKRAKERVAESLHQLGIVVLVNTKTNTGYRELPTTGTDLKDLLHQVQQDANKKPAGPSRKKLSELITRATIASDECDFGTGLLLGLDVFTAGPCLEVRDVAAFYFVLRVYCVHSWTTCWRCEMQKEALQLLRVAYMLLRRANFYKIASGHCKHRSLDDPKAGIQSIAVVGDASTDKDRKMSTVELPQPLAGGNAAHSRIASVRTESAATVAAMAEHKKEAIATEQKELAPMEKSFWYKEALTEDLYLSAALKTITFEAKSKFQTMQIIETHSFGKTLVLDGKTQSAKNDEAIYHETLVHPALLAHPNPKTVYIGGGGEFATAREVLKHKSVEKVVMVDIDELVCNMCRKEMPEWADGAFEDPRLEVHYTDAHAFLKQYDGTFDVIIMDIADPIEAGPGYVLYTEEFYKYAVTKLNKGGYMVTQSGPGAVYNWDECFSAIYSTLKTNFNTVVPYTVDIPSFGCIWAFNMATNVEDGDGEAAVTAIRERSIATTNNLVETRISKPLKFLDGVSHMGLFGLPKIVRESLEKETRVITVDNPVFMF